MPNASPQTRTACPHCGGTSGIVYKAKLITDRWASWDGQHDEEVSMSCMVTPARGKCEDCGRFASIQQPKS